MNKYPSAILISMADTPKCTNPNCLNCRLRTVTAGMSEPSKDSPRTGESPRNEDSPREEAPRTDVPKDDVEDLKTLLLLASVFGPRPANETPVDPVVTAKRNLLSELTDGWVSAVVNNNLVTVKKNLQRIVADFATTNEDWALQEFKNMRNFIMQAVPEMKDNADMIAHLRTAEDQISDLIYNLQKRLVDGAEARTSQTAPAK